MSKQPSSLFSGFFPSVKHRAMVAERSTDSRSTIFFMNFTSWYRRSSGVDRSTIARRSDDHILSHHRRRVSSAICQMIARLSLVYMHVLTTSMKLSNKWMLFSIHFSEHWIRILLRFLCVGSNYDVYLTMTFWKKWT